MSRLAYDKESPSPVDEVRGGPDVSNYLDKVSKLIPSEIIAGYLTIFGLIATAPEGMRKPLYWGSAALCFILTPIYLYFQAEANKPKYVHLIVSTVAFLIWAYVTTGSTLVGELYNAAVASIFLIVFSLISGIIPLKT